MVISTGRALLDPVKALKRAGLKSDMFYADLGVGTLGHFVFPAAEIVGPEGRVYAVDILKNAVESIKSRVRLESTPNVLPLWGDMEREGGVRINSGSLDLVSLVGLADLILRSPTVLDEVRRLLRINGHLLIIDWTPGTGSIIIKDEDRIASELVIGKVLSSPFRLIEKFKAGQQHWGLVFKRVA